MITQHLTRQVDQWPPLLTGPGREAPAHPAHDPAGDQKDQDDEQAGDQPRQGPADRLYQGLNGLRRKIDIFVHAVHGRSLRGALPLAGSSNVYSQRCKRGPGAAAAGARCLRAEIELV